MKDIGIAIIGHGFMGHEHEKMLLDFPGIKLMTTGTSLPFGLVMCAGMSFISIVLMGHLPLAAWIGGLLKMLPLFIVLAWILSYIFVPVFMGLAQKIVLGENS